MAKVKISKSGWDLLVRSMKRKSGGIRMFGLDGTVMEFGPEWLKKDGTFKKSLVNKIAALRADGVLT